MKKMQLKSPFLNNKLKQQHIRAGICI